MPPCGAGVSSMARFVYGLFGLWNGRPPGAVFNFQFSICNLQSALGNPKAVSVSTNFEFAAPALLERLPVDVSRRGDVPQRDSVGLENGNLLLRVAASGAASYDLVQLLDALPAPVRADESLNQVAGLSAGLLAAVDGDDAGARDRGVIQLAAILHVGADGVAVRPGPQPGAPDHRLA